MRATGMPLCMVATTASTAPRMVAKVHTAEAIVSGTGCSRTVTSVITPSVPSAPTKSFVKSYPVEDFFTRRPVVMIFPVGVTTRSASTFSRIVP